MRAKRLESSYLAVHDADQHDPGDQAEQNDGEKEALFEGVHPVRLLGLLSLLLHVRVAARGSRMTRATNPHDPQSVGVTA